MQHLQVCQPLPDSRGDAGADMTDSASKTAHNVNPALTTSDDATSTGKDTTCTLQQADVDSTLNLGPSLTLEINTSTPELIISTARWWQCSRKAT